MPTEDALLDFLRRTGWRISIAADGPRFVGTAELTQPSGETARITASAATEPDVATKLFECACQILYGRRPVFEDPPPGAIEPRH